MNLLKGTSAVITGSGRGIGRAYAKAMAREGAQIVVNDIDADEAERVVTEIKTDGGEAVANGDNIADWRGAGRLISQCVGAFGKIDVLINNAAIHHATPIWEETEAQYDETLHVVLKGTFNPSRHALSHMVPKKSGCIINVTSGAQAGLLGQSVYGAAKAGVASFTYTWALELAPYNIRVNAISPLAATRLGAAMQAKVPSYVEKGYPPENLGPLAVFLASDDARYITGQVIRLDGNILSLFSHPKPVHPVIQPNGWTVDDLRKYFKETIGKNLEPVGLRAARYEYYDGLGAE